MLNIYERECVCICACERAAVSSSKPLVCSRPPRPSSPRFQRAVLPPSTQPPPLRSWFLPQVARAGAAPQPGPLCLSARRSRDLPSSRTRHVLCTPSAHQPTGRQIARWLCAARCLHAKYSRAAASDVEGDLLGLLSQEVTVTSVALPSSHNRTIYIVRYYVYRTIYYL